MFAGTQLQCHDGRRGLGPEGGQPNPSQPPLLKHPSHRRNRRLGEPQKMLFLNDGAVIYFF